MKQKDLAAALNVDPAMITRLKQRGMPTHSVEAAQAWRDAHLSWRLTKDARAATPPAPAAVPSTVVVPLTGTVWENRARREAAEADLAEIKLAELQGQLVRAADVRAALARRAAAFRESLMQIPSRLAAQLAAEGGESQGKVHRLIEAEIRAALELLTREATPTEGQA